MMQSVAVACCLLALAGGMATAVRDTRPNIVFVLAGASHPPHTSTHHTTPHDTTPHTTRCEEARQGRPAAEGVSRAAQTT